MDHARDSSVIRVGDGRGFVVGGEIGRYVITAGHCLPNLPPSHPMSYREERTYPRLLGTLGAEPTVSAECLFVDPIADIAVLGTPDNQELWKEADAHEQLTEAHDPLPLCNLCFAPTEYTLASGEKIFGPSIARVRGQMLSLAGPWFSCEITVNRWIEIKNAEEKIAAGMSGSPIVTDGGAVGVVSTSDGGRDGIAPFLPHHLPGWLLRELIPRT